MKRRIFGLLAGTGLASLKYGYAWGQAAQDASVLTSTLTPVGAERAGNAAGTIPAWTGGYTTLPDGWKAGEPMPDFFAGEQPVLTIDASNVAQYSGSLPDGTIELLKKNGFKVVVYQTHRTASAPQWIYDNIAKNLVTAKLDPAGPRIGFSGAYGGIPFPIPSTGDSYAAGAEVMWNHTARWQGGDVLGTFSSWIMSKGQPNQASEEHTYFDYPYYDPNGSLATFKGWINRNWDAAFLAPPDLIGEQALEWDSTSLNQPPDVWEVLTGQARVRKEPQLLYDTPSSFTDGEGNYDEYFGFYGELNKYDWKLLGKKEMYVPYNNNGLFLLPPDKIMQPTFVNPDVVRYELHRVWVVEATLHPGERNVLARRRFYVDEDTWGVNHTDSWDANGNLFHVQMVYPWLRPDMPGVWHINDCIYNLQTGDYAMVAIFTDQQKNPTLQFYPFGTFPSSDFDPENMAASSQY